MSGGQEEAQRYASVNVRPESASVVAREFRGLIGSGHQLIAPGSVSKTPTVLLSQGFTPKSKVTVFDTDIYFTRPRQNPDLRFFVAYVRPAKGKRIYARIVYKDISLIWRSASHLFLQGDEMWVGKGDVRVDRRGDYEYVESVESTTDLPFELQTAVELLNRVKTVRHDVAVLAKVLRPASRSRIRAFADFTRPRSQAKLEGRQINGGQKVVRFRSLEDPSSLEVVPGYEPDWDAGLVETYAHPSRLYGGKVTRYRFLSVNREIQHLLFLAPRHTWMIPPQALSTDLSSYGVRVVDVNFDEEAYVPGFEYHFEEESGEDDPHLHSQIPEGYVGDVSEIDDSRADASAWLDELPLLQEFRRRFG